MGTGRVRVVLKGSRVSDSMGRSSSIDTTRASQLLLNQLFVRDVCCVDMLHIFWWSLGKLLALNFLAPTSQQKNFQQHRMAPQSTHFRWKAECQHKRMLGIGWAADMSCLASNVHCICIGMQATMIIDSRLMDPPHHGYCCTQ